MNSSSAILRGLTTNQSATGTTLSSECLLHSIRCVTSTSLVLSVYDNTSAAGKQLLASLAMTAGTSYPVTGSGGGVLRCRLGVHCVIESGSGSFDVMTAE